MHFQFYVQPNQSHKQANKENSSRARSFLFLCLGVTIATCCPKGTPLIVPENGLISLNIPLTKTRIGSHSTRTTHPYYLNLLNEFLRGIGIDNQIENPYQWMTKGEMINKVKKTKSFKKLYLETISCAHPDVSRWSGASPNQHCGYCVPCIIRRASIKAAGIADKKYFMDIIKSPPSMSDKKGMDYKAFKMALVDLGKMNNNRIAFHILSSGPIPTDSKETFNRYVETFKRGMNEVKALIG